MEAWTWACVIKLLTDMKWRQNPLPPPPPHPPPQQLRHLYTTSAELTRSSCSDYERTQGQTPIRPPQQSWPGHPVQTTKGHNRMWITTSSTDQMNSGENGRVFLRHCPGDHCTLAPALPRWPSYTCSNTDHPMVHQDVPIDQTKCPWGTSCTETSRPWSIRRRSWGLLGSPFRPTTRRKE